MDLSVFNFNEADRQERRKQLNLEGRLTLVYSGSLDGWYLTEEMADFFATFLQQRPDVYLLWLTTGSPNRVKTLMDQRGIHNDSFSVQSVSPKDVPSYLSAADAGISFYKPGFSRLATSPTKNGEYLACGLPVILNAGIGDSDMLATEWNVGALVTEFTEQNYSQSIDRIEQLAREPDIRTRARAVAKELFDLESVGGVKYAALYERVLSS